MDKLSYSLGIGIGSQLLDMGSESLVAEDFAQAVKDVIEGNPLAVDQKEAQKLVNQYLQDAEARKHVEMSKKGAQAKSEGEKYLEENAKKPEVKTLPSGLQYVILNEGSGKKPKTTDNVKCHYEGTLIDGTIFDSSYRRGEPAVFPLNGVIAGWTEGLQLMNEGAKYRFFIPFDLAYGENGAGNLIPPYAALIFDVELLQVM
ncbi:MAG: FKBP-type peptidyl-prolyl cis-trans isomerase [Bacteroidaceae bacterium]|jgi:FKBP-type peptidyl-prolyl cis-trans isomerase FklB|nr:FKBP-type peptidyl-prolyl cis-trans isomerase [Bacteroidaceae bacterium]